MGGTTSSWVFVNEKNQDEKIIVHDPVSAQLLKEILKTQSTPWSMKDGSAPETRVVTPPPGPKVLPKAKAVERRTQERFNVDLRIILISKGKSFRNISQDVSLGGIKLKSRVPPEFVGQQCVAYLSNTESNENIEIVCQVISDPNDPRRIQFVDANSEQLKRLQAWLVAKASLQKAG